MANPEREQFKRFLCLLERRPNRWLNIILRDVNTPQDILYYLHSCVKEELQIYMSVNLCDEGPKL